MFKFRNIDDLIPGRFERVGMLKGKRWYIDLAHKQNALFKPKRFEFGDRKVFCANHYGEFMGYLLAENSGIPVCKAELAHLSKYYPNIHKEINNGTPVEKDGCLTYSKLAPEDELEPGKTVIEYFSREYENRFKDLTINDINKVNASDNLEVMLSALEARIRKFYRDNNNQVSSSTVDNIVKENRKKAIQMMVYDCLYGNNDRHDENWSLVRNKENVGLYELYDNERVLGLHENQNVITKAINDGNVDEISEKMLFSRMRVPGEKKVHSTYKDVLNYLMQNYKPETIEAVSIALKSNTVEKVQEELNLCEGLPQCYIDFAVDMYSSRYNFAKQLYKNKDAISHENKDDGNIDR